jgi:hypothetical protein
VLGNLIALKSWETTRGALEAYQDLSEQIYGSRKPYFAEMLLFAAPTRIIEDIKRSVTVTIACENETLAGKKQFERSQDRS